MRHEARTMNAGSDSLVGRAERHAHGASPPSDEAAQVAAARTDSRAFADLYQQHVGAIYRYCYVQVGNRQDAEDLTSIVFSEALAGFARYQGRGTFAAWLFGIARHRLRDHLRRRRTTLDVTAVEPPPLDPGPSPEEAALDLAQRSALYTALRRLPEEQREALALHYFSGLRPAEIARIQGHSAGAARMRLHRAHHALRAYLAEEERS